MSFRALVEKSPAIEMKTIVHDQPKTLARRGSLPSVAGATVSASARFSRYGYAYAQNDNLLGRARRLIRISIIKTKRTPVPPCHCEERNARRGNLPEGKRRKRTRASQMPAVAHRRTRLTPKHSPAGVPCRANQMPAVAHRRREIMRSGD